MIVRMTRVRVLGPRENLERVVRAAQDLGLLHLAPPTHPALRPALPEPRRQAERVRLQRALEDTEAALALLGLLSEEARSVSNATTGELSRLWLLARRVRRAAERLRAERASLEEQRALALKYSRFFEAFGSFLANEGRFEGLCAYHVVLRARGRRSRENLRAALARAASGEYESFSQSLPTGETALLVVAPARAAKALERVLVEARVAEIPVPTTQGTPALANAIERMIEDLRTLPMRFQRIERERERLVALYGSSLRRARACIRDRLAELDALDACGQTFGAFVLEAWAPACVLAKIEQYLRHAVGDPLAIEEVPPSEWPDQDPPVALSNPRFLKPFETLIALLPPPRYGSVDPTPYVAVFFPVFYGIILGDAGYGVVLGACAWVLRARSRARPALRSASEVALVCMGFAVLFGLLFGEIFGDAGRRLLGFRPLLLHREESVEHFLALAIAIGFFHVTLGLALGAFVVRRRARKAWARLLSACMVALSAMAVLSATGMLPHALLVPCVVALGLALSMLVLLEGGFAPMEFLATLGHVLSYARIMAVGTASVMLALVANQMPSATGSVVVGALLAMLLHALNLVLGVFSPAIHALRLHYVEFFGKFYAPGSVRYAPLARAAPPERSAHAQNRVRIERACRRKKDLLPREESWILR